MELDKDGAQTVNSVPQNAPAVPDEKPAGEAHHKKHAKPKKKDSSLLCGNEITEILKSTSTPDEKIRLLCNKYSEVLHANRKLMVAYKMSEGKVTKLQQENEQCQQQRSKVVLQRSRLENLCRELQKLNKAQKEEIDLKLRLEEEKRKEISATFQSAFAEMSTLTSQNTEKNTKMREENLEMREKIKSVRERIELSEQQLEKVRQQAQLELQLAEAKMSAVKMEMTAEKEHLLKENQQLLLKLTECQVKISELQATEVGLRSQINMYTEKYDDFQNALTKSNEVFNGFNEEMEKMSKKMAKLEKETSLWKQRWEKSHVALLEMAADKQTRDAEMEKLNHKVSLLQELCKAFQRERTELLAQVRASKVTTANNNNTNSNDNSNNSSSSTAETKKTVKDIKVEDEALPEDCQKLKNDLDQLQQSLDKEKLRDKMTSEVIVESVNDSEICTEGNEAVVQETNEINKNDNTDIQTANPSNVEQISLPESENELSNSKNTSSENSNDSSVVEISQSELSDATGFEMIEKNECLDNCQSNDKIIVENKQDETNVENIIEKMDENTLVKSDDNLVIIANENITSSSLTTETCVHISEDQISTKTEKSTSSALPAVNIENVDIVACITEENSSGVAAKCTEDQASCHDNNMNKDKAETSTKQSSTNISKKGKDGKRKK